MNPPDIMVITLPNLLIHCTQRQNLKKYMMRLPASLPETIWSPGNVSISQIMAIYFRKIAKLIWEVFCVAIFSHISRVISTPFFYS